MFRWLLPLLLVSCTDTASYFYGAPVTRIAVDGSVFDVRVRGNLAEAVRVNLQYAPRLGSLRAKASFAMSHVSGCPVMDVLGDQAVTTGVLGCDPEQGEWLIRTAVATPQYDCIEVGAWVNEGPGPNYAEFECSPY